MATNFNLLFALMNNLSPDSMVTKSVWSNFSILFLQCTMDSLQIQISDGRQCHVVQKCCTSFKTSTIQCVDWLTLRDEPFVLHYKSSSVDVYRASDFVESRQISVPGMKDPWSLAACPHNNCLYISDREHIYRVDLSSSSVSKWSVGESPCGLSVTRNHHLLVTLPRTNRIREYTTHGDVRREINLDVSIDYPEHSIELSSGQFVVCHWGDTQHRVCTVDTSGRIVQSYGGPPGSSAGQLNGPRCLAVDKRGYVLVTDLFNNKVQILSPALTHLCDVTLPEHKLRGPCRLHLDEQRERLYVGEDRERRIHAFVFSM